MIIDSLKAIMLYSAYSHALIVIKKDIIMNALEEANLNLICNVPGQYSI